MHYADQKNVKRCLDLAILSAVALAILASLGHAATGNFSDFETPALLEQAQNWKSPGYIYPNELQPVWERPILDHSSSGVQVSVGTERGFIAAALNRNATQLLLLDRDPKVVLFNRINTALLTAAKNRKDYLRLRFAKSPDEWPDELKDTLLSSNLDPDDAWRFWNREVVKNRKFESFHLNNSEDFESANYLFDDVLFSKISGLAKAGRIDALQLDLSDTQKVQLLVNKLQELHLTLSSLDISNAWQSRYIERKRLAALLKQFGKIATANSTFVITRRNYGIDPAKQAIDTQHAFVYEGYTFDRLSDSERVARVLQEEQSRGPLTNSALNPEQNVKQFASRSLLQCLVRGLTGRSGN